MYKPKQAPAGSRTAKLLHSGAHNSSKKRPPSSGKKVLQAQDPNKPQIRSQSSGPSMMKKISKLRLENNVKLAQMKQKAAIKIQTWWKRLRLKFEMENLLNHKSNYCSQVSHRRQLNPQSDLFNVFSAVVDEEEEPQDLVSPTFDSNKSALAAQSTSAPIQAQLNTDLREILSFSKTKVAEPQEEALINSYEQDQLDKFLEVLKEKQDSGKKEGANMEETKVEEQKEAEVRSFILKNVQRKSKDYSGLKPIREQRNSSPFDGTSGRRSKSKHDISPGPSGCNSNRDTAKKSKHSSQVTSPEDNRYDEFMNFLDKQIETPLQPVETTSVSPYISNSFKGHFTSPQTIDAQVAVIGAKEKMVGYEMELHECQETIRMLKQSVEQQKRAMAKMEAHMDKRLKEEVERVKQQFEGERHKAYALSEEVIGQKKTLLEKIRTLEEKLEEVETTSDKKLRQAHESHKIEMRRNKDAWLASEKMRRQQWEKQREQEIKALTVKSIEPEVNQIIKKKDAEVKQAKRDYERKLREEMDSLETMHEKRIKELRSQLNKEREEAVERERETAHRNMKKQEQRMEEEFEAERKRWKKTMTEEADMKDSMRRKEQKELQSEMRQLKKEIQTQESRMVQERKKILEEAEEKNMEALQQLRSKMEKEHEEWKDIFDKEKARQMEEFKIATIQELQREKDIELERIIEKLSEESENMKSINRHQLELERKDIEGKHRELLAKEREMINEWRKKYEQQKEVNQQLNQDLEILSKNLNYNERERNEGDRKIDQLQRENEQLNAKLQNYHLNLSKEREIQEKRHMEIRTDLDQKIRELSSEVQKEKTYSDQKIRDMRSEQKNAMEMLEDRVRAAMQKKDEQIRQLGQELKTKDIQLLKSKELLDKQRRQLLQN